MDGEVAPLSYEQILDLYRKQKDNPAAAGMDLKQFSSKLNELSGSRAFDQGLSDNWIKRASVGVDDVLAASHIPQYTGDFFQSIGDLIGPNYGQTARKVGEGLPRSVLEGLGVGAAMAVPTPLTIGLGALGTLSAAAKGYTETGSPVAGLIHGGVNLLFPEAGRLGAKYITGPISKRIGENIVTKTGIQSSSPVLERLVDYLGESVGQGTLMELASQGTKLATGQPLGVSGQDLFGDILGLTAFAPHTLFRVIRGPEAGNWESMGHMLRAQDQAAAELKQQTAFINTEQQKVPLSINQSDSVPVAGNTIAGTPSTVIPREPFRSSTLFGRPIEDVMAQKRPSQTEGVRLLNEPDPNTQFIGRELRWEDPIQQVTSGTKREGKTFTFKEPATPEETMALIAKSAAIVEQGVVGTGAEGVRIAAETANELAKQTGAKPVTDESIVKQMDAHTETLTPEETLRRVQQSLENKVNQQAAEVAAQSKRQKTGMDANERLAALPDPVKEFLGEAIVEAQDKASKSHSAISDLTADAHTKAALGWLEKHPMTEADLAKMTPAEKNTAQNDLVRSLNKATELTAREHAVSDKKKGIQHGTEKTAVAEASPVEVPLPKAHDGADPFAVAAHEAETNDYQTRATEALGKLLTSGDVKPQELASVGMKADEILGRKVMAILKDISLGASFGDEGGAGKKGFKFTPSEDTRKVFGGVKDATIQKFVTDNLKGIRQILENRLAKEGVDFSASSETVKEASKLNFSGWDPKLENPMEGSFAPAVQRFMTRYFMEQGHTPQIARAFSQTATKMALMYKNISRTNILELVDQLNAVQGVSMTRDIGGKVLGAIGINLKAFKIGDEAFRRFMLNYTLGHEIFHRVWMSEAGSNDPVRLRVLATMRENVNALSVSDRESILTSAMAHIVRLKDMLDTRPDGAAAMLNAVIKYGAETPTEFEATYMGLLAIGAASPRHADVREDIMFSPKFLSDFANGFYNDLRDVTSGVIAMAQEVGVDKTAMYSTINTMHDTFTSLAKTQLEIEKAVQDLQRAEQTTPQYFQRLVDTSDTKGAIEINRTGPLMENLFGLEKGDASIVDMAKEYWDKTGVKDKMEPYLGKRPNWFEKNMMVTAQMTELYPELGDVRNLIYGYRGEAENRITKGFAPFMTADALGKAKFDKDAPLITVANSERMTDAMSQIALAQGWDKKEYSRADAEKLPGFQKLSPQEKDTVFQLKDQWKTAMNNMADTVKEYHMVAIGDALAGVLTSMQKLRARDAIPAGQNLVKVMMAMKEDPTQVPILAPQLEAAVGSFTPEVRADLLQTFNDLYPHYLSSKEKLDAQRNFYSPETRLGQFYIRYTKDGIEHFVGKKDINEAHDYIEGLKKDPTVDQGSLRVGDKFDRHKDVNMLYADQVNVYSNVEKAAYQKAIERAGDPVTQDVMEKLYTPGEAIFKEVVARGFTKHFMERKLAPGREEINMVQGMVAYIEGVGMGMAKSITKRRAGLLLSDTELMKNPQLRHLGRDWVTTVVDPPAREWSKFKSMVFHWYMGGNISSLIVERMQPLFSLVPELTRQGAGIAGGYKLTGEALKELFNLSTKDKTSLPDEWDVKGAISRAQHSQVLDYGVLQELDGIDTDSAIVSLRNAALEKEGLSVSDLVTKPLYMYGHMMRGIYMNATSYNAKTAFLSGYIFKKRAGATNDEAFDFASRITRSTMFGGGAAARPIGMFANKGNLTGAIGALYTLRHYSFSMVSNMYRLYKEAFSKSVDLSDTDRGNARKALGQMVATQLFMSGALGLPAAGATVAVLQQMFPNLQLKAWLREGLDSLAGDDEKMGHLYSDLALKGVLSAMTPFDLSQRLGLGDLFGLDPNKGATSSAIFGAAGSFVERMVGGVQEASQGNAVEAARQFLPNSLGTLIKLHHDDYKIRDKFGNLIYEPDQVEVLGAAIGFRPKKLADYRDQQALVKNADDVGQRQMREFHDQLSEVLLRGQPELVRQALLSRQLADENYDARAGLRAVVENAQRRLLPADLLSSGSKSVIPQKEAIGRTFAQERGVPTESQLLMQRKQMERQVGVPGAGQVHPAEMRKAQVVDYLQRLNPGMSRQHALVLAERLTGGASANRGRPELQVQF